jgi:DNA-binding CsgD family transcriptional regulator
VRAGRKSRSRDAVANASEAALDAVRVDLALRDFVRRLDEAPTREDIWKSLSLLGALFQMPHVYCAERGEGGVDVRLTAPSSQRRVANTFAQPPLADVLSISKNPMSLRDVVKILGPDWREPPELDGLQAVAVNVEPSPTNSLHVIFFGRQGVVNGLSKSLLFLGAHLAAHRAASAGRRPEGKRTLTSRERQILDLAKSGLTDPKIGKTLGITTRTVRFHLSNAIKRAGAETRAQLIAKSSQRS